LFGYRAAEVIGHNITMLMPAPHRGEHDDYLAHYRQTGEAHIIGRGREVRGQHRDGRLIPLALAVSELYADGRRAFLGILHDLTARVQAEEALRQAHDALEQRVQERTSALSAAYAELRLLSDTVAHDLRSPLINVQGFAHELTRTCEELLAILPSVLPALADTQRTIVTTALETDIPESLHFINAGVSRMDTLLEAVSTLSRLGLMPLHDDVVDMALLVQECLQALERQIRVHQVCVTLGPLPQLHVDVMAMPQIVSNLLSNALKAMVPERPGELHITATPGPETTAFQIQDNGCGIAATDLPHLFEAFRRFGSQESPGTGMGLTYVQTWCAAMGAR
jgi:PAS domain S-box-containing protein